MGARIPLPSRLIGGPFTTLTGSEEGLGRDRLRGPDLAQPYRGVRSPVPVTTLSQRCEAFQLRMPPDAFFCSTTAAGLMGVPLPRRHESSLLLHVAVPHPRRALAATGVVGHKLQVTDDHIRILGSLRSCGPESVWCQLAAVLSLSDLVAAGDYLIARKSPRSTKSLLAEAVRKYPGRRGTVALRFALDLLSDRSESRKESQLRVMLVQAGFGGLVANLEIKTSGGWTYRADLAFPAEKFIIEYQGEHHNHSVRFRADMTRGSRLEADGWFVMQVNADDLYTPAELVQRIRTALHNRPTFS